VPAYNWSCTACNHGNKAEVEVCTNCGCSANSNSYDVKARKFLIKKSGSDNPRFCKHCKACSLDVRYSKEPMKYYYNGLKGRLVLFEILYVTIFCLKCSYREEFEFDVPFLRKIYRSVTGKDIESYWLRRI